jgi:nicotinamidase-related amidase
LVIRKHYPNAFRDTPLLDNLKTDEIGHLVVAGMMTHMCVDATVRAASDHGFRCTLLHDACAARELSFGGDVIPAAKVHAAFMSALNFTYAKVVRTEEFIAGSPR